MSNDLVEVLWKVRISVQSLVVEDVHNQKRSTRVQETRQDMGYFLNICEMVVRGRALWCG